MIEAVARSKQLLGHQTIGVAVSGSTAERLGRDSPALEGQTLTVDALLGRAERGSIQLDSKTTVILDEAGMIDHARLDGLTELIERSGAKLVAVGDGKQLPAIGPGGMFDRIAERTPGAELSDIHRTKDPAERQAWGWLRSGDTEKAMAHYYERSQLFFRDTREEAAEAAVQRWSELTEEHGVREVALIAASNVEIERLNARAQHLRSAKGELGQREVKLPGVHYGLREGRPRSPSGRNTARGGSPGSRTARGGKSRRFTPRVASRSRSMAQDARFAWRPRILIPCAWATPNTSTASRAPPSSAP